MANNFAADPSCKALWNFESGALAIDSIGPNTLTLGGSPAADTVKFKQGAASIALVAANSKYGYITDANLPAGFPLKSTDTVKKFSIGGWFYANSATNYNMFFGKDHYGDYMCLNCYLMGTSLYISWGNGTTTRWNPTIFTGVSLSTWYHLTIVGDGVNNIVQAYLFNSTTQTWQSWSATPTNVLGVNTENWNIGAYANAPTNFWDGNIDEFFVFNRILTFTEVKAIAAGVYAGPIINHFNLDPSCQALWRFESGALTADSIGANTLTPANSPGNAPTYQEGLNAAALVNASHQYFAIPDASLSANFPMKSGDVTKKVTICGWFYANSLSAQRYLWGKNIFPNSGAGGVMLSCYYNSLYLSYAYSGGRADTLITSGLITGRWYHCAIIVDGVNKTVEGRLWDTVALTVTDVTATMANPMAITADDFRIGAFSDQNSNYTWDGYIDEVVVFNRLLSQAEVDLIRNQNYVSQTPGSCRSLTTCQGALFPLGSCRSLTTCGMATIPPLGYCRSLTYCPSIQLAVAGCRSLTTCQGALFPLGSCRSLTTCGMATIPPLGYCRSLTYCPSIQLAVAGCRSLTACGGIQLPPGECRSLTSCEAIVILAPDYCRSLTGCFAIQAPPAFCRSQTVCIGVPAPAPSNCRSLTTCQMLPGGNPSHLGSISKIQDIPLRHGEGTFLIF